MLDCAVPQVLDDITQRSGVSRTSKSRFSRGLVGEELTEAFAHLFSQKIARGLASASIGEVEGGMVSGPPLLRL